MKIRKSTKDRLEGLSFMHLLYEYKNILKSIINTEKFNELNDYVAHGRTTVLKHSLNVAAICLFISRCLRIKVRLSELIISALLHDLYLYDWHDTKSSPKLHGFVHSTIAAENAKEYFDINENIYNNIKTHMWPLNITYLPKTREGVIVCIADKIAAIKEIFVKQ